MEALPETSDVAILQLFRVHQSHLANINAEYGDAVEVELVDDTNCVFGVFLCKVWPSKTSDHVTYSRLVTKCDGDFSGSKALPSTLKLGSIKPCGRPQHAKSVHVRVFTNSFELAKLRKTASSRQSDEFLQRLSGIVSTVLKRKLVCEGAVVDCGNFKLAQLSNVLRLQVTSLTSSNRIGVISDRTVVVVDSVTFDCDVADDESQLDSSALYLHFSQVSSRMQTIVQALQRGSMHFYGALLRGASGTGKSHFVRRFARSMKTPIPLVYCDATQLFGAQVGDAEARLRRDFERALALSQAAARPALLVLDDIDLVCGSSSKEHMRLAQVLASLVDAFASRRADSDSASASAPGLNGEAQEARLFLLGVTNRIGDVNAILRSGARFDAELTVPKMTSSDRRHVLETLLHYSNAEAAHQEAIEKLAELTASFTLNDLLGLCKQAVLTAYRRSRQNASSVTVSDADLFEALQHTEPRSIRTSEFAANMIRFDRRLDTSSPLLFDLIGGLTDVKQRLIEAIELPLSSPDAFQRFGVTPARGVLLYGPPGCAKTTLVRAIAERCSAQRCADAALTCLFLSCAHLLSAFVGDSEKHLVDAFRTARQHAPALLFFDELDALVANRFAANDSEVSNRLLSTFLCELDGVGHNRDTESDVDGNQHVLVVCATNRPDCLDPALVRPGRIEVSVYVPPPDLSGRLDILKKKTSRLRLSADCNLEDVANTTELFSGAELEALCNEAAFAALRERLQAEEAENIVIEQRHFQEAMTRVHRVLTNERLVFYENFAMK